MIHPQKVFTLFYMLFHIHTIYAMLSTYNAIYCLLNWCNELSRLQKFDSSNISYSPNVYLNKSKFLLSCISKLICPFVNFEITHDLLNHSIFLGHVFQHTKPKLIKISKPPVIMIMYFYSYK